MKYSFPKYFLINNIDSQKERAFTLIEIAIAIAIFGIALSTLMASTTRLMDTSFSEVQRSRASIFAAYLLEVELLDATSIGGASNNQSSSVGGVNPTQNNPAQNNPAPLGGIIPNKSGKLINHLRQAGYFDNMDQRQDFTYLNENWHFELINEPLELALLPVPPQHIRVRIYWGNHDSEQYLLEAILPPPKSMQAGGTTGGPNQNGLGNTTPQNSPGLNQSGLGI